VAALVTVIPSKPVEVPGTGSVRSLTFRSAARPPTGVFNFGPYFVNAGATLYMAGSDGNSTTVWSSTDGSNWQAASNPGSFGAPGARFVIHGFSDDGNGGLVAVGNSFPAGAKVQASAWHSRDGKTWTQASVDFPDDTEMFGLASRPGTLVSAGNGVAWYSADGSSWNVIYLPNATGYVPVAVRAWAGGFAILATSSGTDARHTAAWVSDDGKIWTRAPSNLEGFQVKDVVAFGNGLVAVGSQVLTPAELATPTPSPTPSPTPGPSTKAKATPKPTPTPKKTAAPSGAASPSPSPTPPPPVEVAVSWISPDGINWYRGNALAGRQPQALESISQVSDSLVASGSEPGVLTAGATPTGAPSASESSQTATRPATLWTSDDGLTWKPMSAVTSAMTRSRLTPFGQGVVLAGVDARGALDVLIGDISLGSPLPVVAATATPPFAVSLTAGATPIAKGLTPDATLGPVLTTSSGAFLVFVNATAGASVYSSPDGSVWATQADPKVLTGSSSVGTPVVRDAISDGEGGTIAVGSLGTSDSQTAAAWHLTGTTWTSATISGTDTPPPAFASVAAFKGNYVAASMSGSGPRLFISPDGLSWTPATISGADAIDLTVASYNSGFVATGIDASGVSQSWTSPDGSFWIAEASWELPAHTNAVYGAHIGLIATSTGVTGNTSWWYSPDGKTWQDSKLTSVGGCWSTLDSGYAVVSAPSGPAPSPAPAAPAAASGSAVPPPNWTLWASRDAHSWQQPASSFGFGGSPTCRMTAIEGRVLIVGWSKAGVVSAYFGTASGL
jgi:hypothetical protein